MRYRFRHYCDYCGLEIEKRKDICRKVIHGPGDPVIAEYHPWCLREARLKSEGEETE